MRKVVQFGAGNIGRGFTAQLFVEAGYEVVFVDVVDEIVNSINLRRGYTLKMASNPPRDIRINNVRAVHGSKVDEVAEEILTARLVCTAVGVNVLPAVAPAIAKGIQRRAHMKVEEPLNIIICENMSHASDFLKSHVKKTLPFVLHDYMEEKVGFVESVVSRMVPVQEEYLKRMDPLLLIVESYKVLPIDKSAFKGDIPNIVGLEGYDNFQGYVDRKLFTHNAGHAIAAYLGYLRGYKLVAHAVADSDVRRTVKAALAETGEALIKKWGFSFEQHENHINDLLNRFGNEALGDQVARVGRDPIRKLGPEDRLVGGAKFALEHGVKPVNMCKGIAAALLYDEPDDPAAVELQEKIKAVGVEGALKEVSGLEPDSEITQEVLRQIPLVKEAFPKRA